MRMCRCIGMAPLFAPASGPGRRVSSPGRRLEPPRLEIEGVQSVERGLQGPDRGARLDGVEAREADAQAARGVVAGHEGARGCEPQAEPRRLGFDLVEVRLAAEAQPE